MFFSWLEKDWLIDREYLVAAADQGLKWKLTWQSNVFLLDIVAHDVGEGFDSENQTLCIFLGVLSFSGILRANK
jgi:hypothetical protein